MGTEKEVVVRNVRVLERMDTGNPRIDCAYLYHRLSAVPLPLAGEGLVPCRGLAVPTSSAPFGAPPPRRGRTTCALSMITYLMKFLLDSWSLT